MSCSLLTPQSAPCSGHGYCDASTSKCICDKGWTSYGDFAVIDGVDCDQSIEY